MLDDNNSKSGDVIWRDRCCWCCCCCWWFSSCVSQCPTGIDRFDASSSMALLRRSEGRGATKTARTKKKSQEEWVCRGRNSGGDNGRCGAAAAILYVEVLLLVTRASSSTYSIFFPNHFRVCVFPYKGPSRFSFSQLFHPVRFSWNATSCLY